MDREEEEQSFESPLLLKDEESLHGFRESLSRRSIHAEIKKQLWLAGPLISVNLLLYLIQGISVMFVGHLGELPLSGASMATSFASVTGFSLLNGMGSALDTLCGQSYGAKQYHMLGVHMQRAMIVLLLSSIPIAIVWAYTGFILTMLGQDPEIAAEAGRYARFMIPSIFAYALLQCHIRFLQTQNIVFPMMISTGITTLLHVLNCWILVFKSGLGNKGAALANATSYWINLLILVVYVNFSPACKKTWTGFSKAAFHNVLLFLRLGIPSALMVCLEIWSFEMVVLLSGRLPNPKLETSVLSISLNTCALVYMIAFGQGGAVSTRVSNELGAGRPQAARLAVCVAVLMFMVNGIVVSSVMVLVRRQWGKCYSSEEEVVAYVAAMMPLIAVTYLFDGVQSILSGTVRGCGRQKIGAAVNLGAYYLVGIPTAIVCAFVFHVGGKGLWLGLMSGVFVQVLALLIITLRTNWDQEADLRRADLLAKRRAMEDAFMALEFVKNIHDMMVSETYNFPIRGREGSPSASDIMSIMLEKNGKTAGVSADRISAIQEVYWSMASALSEADGIDYTDPDELELVVATLIDLDAMDGKSSASLLVECSRSPDVSTRQALANALTAAPSMWTLGNAGMGALQRLAEDSNPAIAAAASKAINELKKQWEIEKGDSRRFTMNQKARGELDVSDTDSEDDKTE